MNNLKLKLDLATESDLERVIEPLANYICANARPRAALKSALAYLVNEVESTNRLAKSYVGLYAENH